MFADSTTLGITGSHGFLMDKITVTAADLQQAPPPALPPPSAATPLPAPAITVGARLATLPLVLVLPLLCLVALILRLALRSRLPRIQLAWAHWMNSLLVASGLLTTILFSMAYFVGPRPAAHPALPMPALEFAGAFPQLPAAGAWNAQQLARETSSLVFVVSPEFPILPLPGSYQEASAVGAGSLLEANGEGFLIVTNRHVVEAGGWFAPRPSRDSVLLFRKDGARARGEVVAIHRQLDLALVWTPRGGSREPSFLQPVASSSDAETGQNVFVIGHPQRLFFSLSTGIVMRLHEEKLLQISAPVSPGNSGGPVFDERGRLLAVVSSKVDRRFNPNAENLNFAVRADAILEPAGWDFQGQGEVILQRFWDNYGRRHHGAGSAPGSPEQAASLTP